MTRAEQIYINRMAANYKPGMSFDELAKSVIHDDARLMADVLSDSARGAASRKSMSIQTYYAIKADIEVNKELFETPIGLVTEEIREMVLSG